MATETILDDIYGYEPPKGSGQFFALEDGKAARVRFQSEPYAYQDNFKQPDGTVKQSTRYAWKIYNHDEKKAQILKQSGTFFTSLAAIARDADYGDPTGYDVKITRNGVGTETKYTITPAKTTTELDKAALAELAELDVVKDSKEDLIVPLREYVKNGKQFEGIATGNGDVIITDNPLDNI